MPPALVAVTLVSLAALSLLAAFWVLVLNVTGAVYGWWTLAREYRHSGRFHGRKHDFRSLRLDWHNYRGWVTVGTNSRGLYLAFFWLFRPGHPPLFIPWADVSAKMVKGWFSGQELELTFARVPGIRVLLPGPQGQELVADANLTWDAEDTPDRDAPEG